MIQLYTNGGRDEEGEKFGGGWGRGAVAAFASDEGRGHVSCSLCGLNLVLLLLLWCDQSPYNLSLFSSTNCCRSATVL